MTRRVVNQYVNVGQREVVFRASLVEVPIVDANADPTILLWHWNDVCHPLRVI
jgi:predicted metalloendopeptidase